MWGSAREAHVRMCQRQRQLAAANTIVELKLQANHLALGVEQQRAVALTLKHSATGFDLGKIPVQRPGIRVE